MDTVKTLNPIMWIFAVLLIGGVLVQALLFLRMALRFNKKNHVLTKEELIRSATTGAVAAIGPSFSSVVFALSIIVMMGSAVAFMRCGVIGTPLFEMYIAQFAATNAGVEFGTPEFTEAIFGAVLFTMILMSLPYAINVLITVKPMDMAVEKVKENTKKKGRSVSFISYLGPAATLCMFSYMMVTNLSSVYNLIVLIAAAATYFIYDILTKRLNNTFISSMNLAVSMVVAMAAGQIARGLIG